MFLHLHLLRSEKPCYEKRHGCVMIFIEHVGKVCNEQAAIFQIFYWKKLPDTSVTLNLAVTFQAPSSLAHDTGQVAGDGSDVRH